MSLLILKKYTDRNGGRLLVSFPDPQAKRREGLGDNFTSTRSGGGRGMQLYYKLTIIAYVV